MMFNTPSVESGRNSRRTLHMGSSSTTTTSRLSRHSPGEEETHPTTANGGGGDGDGEVLTILRSLQQQVSALQAQRNSSEVPGNTASPDSAGTTSRTKKKRLPKSLVSAVHQTLKHLKDRSDDPLEWNLDTSFCTEHNAKVTAEIVKIVADENNSVALVRSRLLPMLCNNEIKLVLRGKQNIFSLFAKTFQKHN